MPSVGSRFRCATCGADRLFPLVQLIRGRRLTTAEWLAARLEVSLRTLYCDVADLQRQGVLIAGSLAVYAPAMVSDNATRERLRLLREACESRRFVQLEYESLQGALSQRRVRPLGVFIGTRYGPWPAGAK